MKLQGTKRSPKPDSGDLNEDWSPSNVSRSNLFPGRRIIVESSGLERLHDHQDDDENHQDGRYLIDNTIEFLASGVPVGGGGIP